MYELSQSWNSLKIQSETGISQIQKSQHKLEHTHHREEVCMPQTDLPGNSLALASGTSLLSSQA